MSAICLAEVWIIILEYSQSCVWHVNNITQEVEASSERKWKSSRVFLQVPHPVQGHGVGLLWCYEYIFSFDVVLGSLCTICHSDSAGFLSALYLRLGIQPVSACAVDVFCPVLGLHFDLDLGFSCRSPMNACSVLLVFHWRLNLGVCLYSYLIIISQYC